MKKTDIAWAAGFVDGEGSICLQGNCATLAIAQKEAEPLTRFRNIFGMGKISYRDIVTPKGKKSWVHHYTINGLEAVLVLALMLPYLTLKKPKAMEAIAKRPHVKNNNRITKPIWGKENQRLLEILKLREGGQTFETIGYTFGVSRQRAYQLYQLALLQDNLQSQGKLIS